MFSGGLDAGSFESNATGVAAVAAGPVIVYNNVTGDLFYDADGTGGGAGTRFALLDPGGNAPALSNEDFAQLF